MAEDEAPDAAALYDARIAFTRAEPFHVVLKTRELLVIDKPPDVRIDGDVDDDTVEKWVAREHPDMVAGGPSNKMRFCHQLDHATSGVLCLAFRKVMAARVSHCFENRTTSKLYLALVHGHPAAPACASGIHTFDAPIADDPSDPAGFKMCRGVLKPAAAAGTAKKRRLADADADASVAQAEEGVDSGAGANGDAAEGPPGRHALTHCIVVRTGVLKDCGAPVSLVVLAPSTGRRHQLRIHCLEWGHPIVGDVCYRPSDKQLPIPRMMLHAWQLRLPVSADDTDGADSKVLAREKAARKVEKKKSEREHRAKNAGGGSGGDGDGPDALVVEKLVAARAEAMKTLTATGAPCLATHGPNREWVEFRSSNRLAAFLVQKGEERPHREK